MKENTQAAADRQTTARTRTSPQEVYIVEYAMSDSAKETASDKLKRLMINEAQRLIAQQKS